ncbi:MAG: asparagine synthase (glutamine-hydrolyzing) [Desulfomonilaceae bacterium]
MCGICGIWGLDDSGALDRMVSAMHHRGPDDCGTFFDNRIGIGMARLSILDLTVAGRQPMSNSSKNIWIVYNGETYNFQDERELLEAKGHRFQSHSDTEVVLRMYEVYGDDFLLRMRGMFALAIYDKRRGTGRERLLLARDQLGIKPLIFAEISGKLLFASEMKALLASRMVTPEIDPVALRMLLTYGSVYQPRTMLKGVRMLLPAHRLIYQGGRLRIQRYWSLGIDRMPELQHLPYEELVDRTAKMMSESVRLQMVSDVPVGAFLSGGVDSSLLVGLMTRIAGRRVRTFSVGFEAEGLDIDESDEACRTATFLDADHRRVVVTGRDVRDRLTHIAASLDQPSVDGVNSYFVSLAARKAVTVAISGTGGDELFAGYPWFPKAAMYEDEKKRSPMKMAWQSWLARSAGLPMFNRLVFGAYGGKLETLRNGAGFVPRYACNYQLFGITGAARMLAPALRKSAQAGQSLIQDLKPLDELSGAQAVERASALCLRGYTNNQLLRDIDAVSMSHSLEVRVPFLDVMAVDFALSLPASSKLGRIDPKINPWTATYREMGSKKVLIDAGRKLGVLSNGIDLQPKRGFGMPFDAWLRGPVREVMEDALDPQTVKRRGFLDSNMVQLVKKGFVNGTVGWAQPWLLMILELWQRQVLDHLPPNHHEFTK